MRFIVKTLSGLENVLAEEIRELGYPNVNVLPRGVEVEADETFIYKGNYLLSTALNILRPVHGGHLLQADALYNSLRQVPWDQYMHLGQTFVFKPIIYSKLFPNSHYAILRAKDALVDYFRDNTGQRPNVGGQDAHIHFVLRIYENEWELLLDSSGQPLNQRKYRRQAGPAPLNEVLAAGILKIAGYNGNRPFLDPMCGSGTFCLEAARLALRIPAQSLRSDFAFMYWPDFNPVLFEQIKSEALGKTLTHTAMPIVGRDKDRYILDLAIQNSRLAGVAKSVRWESADFFSRDPGLQAPLVCINPPYDKRIAEEKVVQFYEQMGNYLKKEYTGCEIWLLSGHLEAIGRLGLKPSKKISLFNGAIPCSLRQYHLFAGRHADFKRDQTSPHPS